MSEVSTGSINSTVTYVEEEFLGPLRTTGTELYDLINEIATKHLMEEEISAILLADSEKLADQNLEVAKVLESIKNGVSDSEQVILSDKEQILDAASSII